MDSILSCQNLTVTTPTGAEILSGASARFSKGGMNAVIGPSGCGKTTLMKAILGIIDSSGTRHYKNSPISDTQQLIGHVGFAPQFSIAQGKLTVAENIRYALDLTVKDRQTKQERLQNILELTGLAEHSDKRVESLSGGQLRRLGLGLEFTTEPECLVCDEVTSGLDPNSEDAILRMLRGLTREQDKSFVCIIHNLTKLDLFDQVTVVFGGDVVFEGSPDALKDYFGISDPLELYDRLAQEELSHWQNKRSTLVQPPQPADEKMPAPISMPGLIAQLWTLLHRRFTLLARDRGYLGLTAAITFGFPCLVVIFALDGLPAMQSLALEAQGSFMERAAAKMNFQLEAAETGALVSGLILFQVILLALMGSNNGAREIAAERTLYEKERISGLRPNAYAISKIIFTGVIALFQGIWMTWFVKIICNFPGSGLIQTIMLAGCAVSMTIVCLGFSALFRSPEKASLVSIYLVGFQIPLSGVVLALPPALVWVCRPLINLYWAWAGYLKTMIDTRFYDAWAIMNQDEIVPSLEICALVLFLHFAAGAVMVFWGCKQRKWQ